MDIVTWHDKKSQNERNIVISIDKVFYKKLFFMFSIIFGIGLAKLFDYFFPEYVSYRLPHYAAWIIFAFLGWVYADI